MGFLSSVMGVGDTLFGEGQAASTGVNPFSVSTGVGTGSFNAGTGASTASLSPELAGLFSQYLQQAGNFAAAVPSAGAETKEMGGGFLSQATTFDPFAAAEEQFARLDAILEPGRTRARTGTAAGLLSTGRLGGTAGNEIQASVEGEIERQRQSLLGSQFTAAQDVQDRLVGRGINLRSLGLTEQAQTANLGQGALSSALNIDSQLQALLGLGSNITKTAPIAPTASGTQSIIQGAASSGLGALIAGI